MNIFDLTGSISISGGDSVNSMLAGIGTTVDNVGGKLQSIGNSLMGFGEKLMGSITMPIANLAVEGVKYNSTVEDLTTSFKVMLGSADKAGDMVSKLKEMGAATPFEFTDLATSTKTLLNFGYTGKEVLPIMSRLGDVSMGNNVAFQSMSRTMGQINALGKLQGGDLNQLIGQGWNPLNQITKRTGETMAQVRDRMSQGKVTYKEVEQALVDVTSKGGLFYGGMAEGSKTLSGRISTLKDNFMSFLGDATKPLFDFISAKVIPILSNLVAYFAGLSPQVKLVILAIAGIIAIIPILIVAFGGILVAAGVVVSAVGAFIAVGWEIILIVVAIVPYLVILGTAFITYAGIVAGVLLKTGILQTIFNGIKGVVIALIAIFKGDFQTALTALTEKLGLTQPQAQAFINKLSAAKTEVTKLIALVKDVSKLLGAIFTADKQEMIDILVKKFGLSKTAAEGFAKKAIELKDKIVELGGKVRDIAIVVMEVFADKVKKVSAFIVEHRAEIAKAIEKIISFGSFIASVMSVVLSNAIKAVQFGSKVADGIGSGINKAISFLNTLRSIVDSVMSGISGAVGGVIGFFNSLSSAVSTVVGWISKISFPSPPSWLKSIPGFAGGVENFGGGFALVGEQGAELVNLPKGSNVYSHGETQRMLSNSGSSGRGISGNTTENYYFPNLQVVIDPTKVKDISDIVDIFKNVKSEQIMRR
jgi:tape measure domain-containing protein